MTGPERGFLLLRSRLGDQNRKPLTQAQFRMLGQRVRAAGTTRKARDLALDDLLELDYDHAMAQRILDLLEEEEKLDRYLAWGEQRGCVPITRLSPRYPGRVLDCLQWDAPVCLWAKGDLSVLKMDKIALVGSRDLQIPNALFAQKVGQWAAGQGMALVSGNARGADTAAQEACLKAGGKVISVVADELFRHPERENVLYLSEEDFGEPFCAQRALSRNRVIHTLGEITCVAQCTLGRGGTWDGTTQNLKNRWSRVICFNDGTPAMTELQALGAELTDDPITNYELQVTPCRSGVSLSKRNL